MPLDPQFRINSLAGRLAGVGKVLAEEASAGLWRSEGELAAARWLDAEDAAMRQVLAWAVAHDTAMALRLADALGWWWSLRGRLAGEYRLLCQAVGRAEVGSHGRGGPSQGPGRG